MLHGCKLGETTAPNCCRTVTRLPLASSCDGQACGGLQICNERMQRLDRRAVLDSLIRCVSHDDPAMRPPVPEQCRPITALLPICCSRSIPTASNARGSLDHCGSEVSAIMLLLCALLLLCGGQAKHWYAQYVVSSHCRPSASTPNGLSRSALRRSHAVLSVSSGCASRHSSQNQLATAKKTHEQTSSSASQQSLTH